MFTLSLSRAVSNSLLGACLSFAAIIASSASWSQLPTMTKVASATIPTVEWTVYGTGLTAGPTPTPISAHLGNGNPIYGKKAMATDAIGNVFVVGSTWDGVKADYLAIKYDTTGAEIWRRAGNAPTATSTSMLALALDGHGNVALFGGFDDGSGPLSMVLVHLDPAGHEQWRKVISTGGSAAMASGPSGLAVDALGNIFVGGVGAGDYLTVKFDQFGNELWRRRAFPNGDVAAFLESIAVDNLNNVVVTGASQIGDGYQFLTIKYDNNGVELWRRGSRMPKTRSDLFELASNVAVDRDGAIIVAGNRQDNALGSQVAQTIRYESNGKEAWRKLSHATNGVARANVGAVAVDAAGNAYVGGWSEEGPNDRARMLTIKYSKGGAELWRANPPSVLTYNFGYDVGVNADGDVVITGVSMNDNFDGSFLTIMHNSSGQELWRVTHPHQISGQQAYALAFGPGGAVYVGGVAGEPGQPEAMTIQRIVELSAVQFSAATVSVDENVGTVRLTVQRAGNLFFPSSVHYESMNGSATSPSDYEPVQGSLDWVSGDGAPKSITITIRKDMIKEVEESFSVVLSNPVGAYLGPNAAEIVKIKKQ